MGHGLFEPVDDLKKDTPRVPPKAYGLPDGTDAR